MQPSAKREGFATVPGVSWQDVGALTKIREELQLSILAPVRFQEEFESLGLPASSGVLLAGPPGMILQQPRFLFISIQKFYPKGS